MSLSETTAYIASQHMGLADRIDAVMQNGRSAYDDMLNTWHAQAREMEAEIKRLHALAYMGEHHFPDSTWKARLEELVPQHRALESRVAALLPEVERLRKWAGSSRTALESLAAELERHRKVEAKICFECEEGIKRVEAANTTPKRRAENTQLAYNDILGLLRELENGEGATP